MIARDFQAKQEKKMMEYSCKVSGLSAFFWRSLVLVLD
jgi:hypothetical protein